MKSARLELDTTSVERSGAGLVIAGIRLHVDGVSFPSHIWTDFAVVVLLWWADAAMSALNGDLGTHEIRFLEGPFLVRLTPRTGGAWHLALVDNFLVPQIRFEGTVRPAPLLRSLVAASDVILALCRDRGWESRDSARLELTISRLRPRVPTAWTEIDDRA